MTTYLAFHNLSTNTFHPVRWDGKSLSLLERKDLTDDVKPRLENIKVISGWTWTTHGIPWKYLSVQADKVKYCS